MLWGGLCGSVALWLCARNGWRETIPCCGSRGGISSRNAMFRFFSSLFFYVCPFLLSVLHRCVFFVNERMNIDRIAVRSVSPGMRACLCLHVHELLFVFVCLSACVSACVRVGEWMRVCLSVYTYKNEQIPGRKKREKIQHDTNKQVKKLHFYVTRKNA